MTSFRAVAAGLAFIAAVMGSACAGDSAPRTAPTSTATTEADATRAVTPAEETSVAAPTSTPQPAAVADPGDAGGGASGGGDLGSILGNVLGPSLSGFASGGGDLPGLQEGDPALLQYVLRSGDVPPGYASMGESTFRAPDGISTGGSADMAMSMFASGDPASGDIAAGAFLMSMAMQFEDLTDLEAMFDAGNLSEADLQQAFEAGGSLGLEVTEFELLNTSGLGDNAVGLTVTIDMGALFEGLEEAFGEGAPPGVDLDALSRITMKMYMFGRGDRAGAVMHMGFGAALAGYDVDLLALARTVDGRLSAGEP
jgi:hypothetical protein